MQIERSISFGFPILLTNLLILRLGTVLISNTLIIQQWRWSFSLIAFSLLLAFALVGFSDGPSGRLELPPVSN